MLKQLGTDKPFRGIDSEITVIQGMRDYLSTVEALLKETENNNNNNNNDGGRISCGKNHWLKREEIIVGVPSAANKSE